MKLIELLETYPIDALMPVINDMFPGTKKYYSQLKKAYEIMMNMKPVDGNQTIHYQLIHAANGKESYFGAPDSNFRSTWQVSLGKNVIRDPGIDLSNIEVAANCFVNLCLQGKYPRAFEEAHQQLLSNY